MISFIDGRRILDRHATKSFSRRRVSNILGGVVHHTAGRDNPYNTASYHVGPNHVSETGCPALLYTFYIRQNGEVWWANDLEDITWSQGGHGSPVAGTDANTNFLAICCAGDYHSASHLGKDAGPPYIQMFALLALWGHLTGEVNLLTLPEELCGILDCRVEDLWGHHNFGKPACPGAVMQSVVDSIRTYAAPTRRLTTVIDWQSALNKVGAALAVDGVWGSQSRAALVDFQRTQQGLVVDGIRGPMSEAALLGVIS